MKRKSLAAFMAVIMLAFTGCSGGSQDAPEVPQNNGDVSDVSENSGDVSDVSENSGDVSDVSENDADVSDEAENGDSAEELFDEAVQDAVFAEESEILPLVTLTKEDDRVTWDDTGRVLLCTWHNYPESYPEGEKVVIEWGPVWTFTDKEIDTYAEELKEAEDPVMRLRQIISFTPDSEHSTVTGFWVDPADVQRPAYQSDPTDGSMVTSFGDDVDETFKEWFDENTLNSYFYGYYPWTRLGYTYDWADNGTEYGMTEFIVNSGAEVEVEFTVTTEEFFQTLFQ